MIKNCPICGSNITLYKKYANKHLIVDEFVSYDKVNSVRVEADVCLYCGCLYAKSINVSRIENSTKITLNKPKK